MATVPTDVVLHMVDCGWVLRPVLVLQRPRGTRDDARGKLGRIVIALLYLRSGVVDTQFGLEANFSNQENT